MTTATETTTQVYSVYIKATPQAIWDAITKPEFSERFGYGGRGEYDLRPGGAYTAYTSQAMRDHGAPDVAIEGEVIEVDPPRKLVQSWHMVMDDTVATEGSTTLTYEITEPREGFSKLTVVHELGDKPTLTLLMSGGMEEQGAGGGWPFVLSSLKTLLETGDEIVH
jgi:uncharacterized protein YndB with AHSA1/START domain